MYWSRILLKRSYLLLLFYLSSNILLGKPELHSQEYLVEVLNEIGEKFQVIFTYDESTVADIKVEVDYLSIVDFNTLLGKVLEPSGLNYKHVGDRYYIIYKDDRSGNRKVRRLSRNLEKIQSLQNSGDLILQSQRDVSRSLGTEVIEEKETFALITGVVSDQSGNPLIGATVLAKGTSIGTATDLNGEFSLEVPDITTHLVISYTGFTSQEYEIAGQSAIDVVLMESSSTLDEVVVVGYGTQKKVNLTGAVDVISNRQIENRQASTVSQILQGQSPGLNITPGINGFQPGASMAVAIRGIGSLNGGSPYILIDGFPGDMDLLNPDDIESISVLKDAAASAIYGARAPYGVILITTKSGRKNEKLKVSYSGNISLNTPDRLPEMLDSYTFAKLVNEAGDNRGGRSYNDEIIDRIIAYQEGDFDYLRQFMPADVTHYETVPNSVGLWATWTESHSNRDWYDEFYGTSLNQRHNLSIQGGSDKTSYFLSAGFLGQEGVLNYGVDTYQRYNLLAKVNTAVKDWWDIRYETRFIRSPREKFNIGDFNGNGYSLLFRQIQRTLPNESKYGGYGQIKLGWSALEMEQRGTDRFDKTENWQTLATELRPIKGLKINADIAYKSTAIDGSIQNYKMFQYWVDGSLRPVGTRPDQLKQSTDNDFYWASNVFVSYDLNISSDHQFFVMAGMQSEYFKSHFLQVEKTGLVVQDVPSLQTANGDAVAYEELNHWATQGYFSRFSYNFREKYLLEANVRYDGTSRFQQGKRWGFFPSFSVGWNIDKEGFWAGMGDVVNAFKARASWGELGNQQVRPYLDRALIPLETGKLGWIFSQGANRPVGYTGVPSLVSPFLTWETATTTNVGVDLSFFDFRLQTTFDWFERTTRDMIGPSAPVEGVLGASVPQSNNATLRSRGWEASVKWNQRTSANGFSWFVGANLYDAKDVVTDYVNPTGVLSGWYPGKTVGEIWGYQADDLFQTQSEVDAYTDQVDLGFLFNVWNPGDLKYLDRNGDGAVNSGGNSLENHGDLSIIGNSTPRYQFGVSAGFNFENFDFSFLLKGTGKRDFSFPTGGNNTRYWGLDRLPFSSLTPEHLDYFRDAPGDRYTGIAEGEANINLDAFWPKLYIDRVHNAKNRHTSTRYLANAAFLRMQNIQLGYNFPNAVLNKLGIEKFRIYIAAENLFTITDLPKGIDPVAITGYAGGAGVTYVPDKIFSLGINLNL